MALTESEVRGLLANPAQESSRATKRAWIRKDGEIKCVALSSVKAADFGKFEGKQGSMRRSRKGLVRILPNGYRKYNDNEYSRKTEVIAYSA
jgi:hypothetical protein